LVKGKQIKIIHTEKGNKGCAIVKVQFMHSENEITAIDEKVCPFSLLFMLFPFPFTQSFPSFFPPKKGIAYHHTIQKMMMVYVAESKSFLANKKGGAIYSMALLPLGKVQHPTDHFELIALATPSQLLILSIKPHTELCFKFNNSFPKAFSTLPCSSWRPATTCSFPFT